LQRVTGRGPPIAPTLRRMTRRVTLAAVIAALALAGCSSGSSGAGPSSGATPPGASPSFAVAAAVPAPSHRTVWLCRPGMRHNPCDGGLDATEVTGPHPGRIQRFTPAAHPRIDCFYVYPTVSNAKGLNAPLHSAPEVVAVARAQAARFAAHCRLFVPVYRQITTAALLTGKYTDPKAETTAYDDVRSAWDDYLRNDNDGRGVVLIGHSQGAMMLKRLIQNEIEPRPAERSLRVSAILLGGNVSVPDGKPVGGDFTSVPACERAAQTGCVLAYSSFATTPPADSLFGRSGVAGQHILCVDPTQLLGEGGHLHPLLPSSRLIGSGLPGDAVPGSSGLSTGFAAYPDTLTAHCDRAGDANVLHVSGGVSGHPVKSLQQLGPAWGLHVADVNLALGDLVAIVGREAAAWRH
jgi:hypothetical protein